MRRSLALCGAVLAIAALAGGSLASSAAARPANRKATINIAVFLASAANTYWEASLQGAQDVAKKNPNVKITVFDGQFNTAKQLGQMRDALVSKKYQAWYVGPNDGGPLVPTIKQAIASGVKVGCSLVPCGTDVTNQKVQIPGQTIFAGTGFLGDGVGLGKLVVQGCAGISDCKVLWLPGLPTLPLEKARQTGLYSVLKSHSNIHVVQVAAGGYLAAPALKATQDVLSAHPDLNVIVSSGDQMIAGAVKAAQAAGLAGKVKMYGAGCTFEAKALILAGKQAGCAVYLPRTEGRLVTQALVDAVNGKGKTGVSINPPSSIGPIGTKANIAKFTPEFHS